MAGEATSNANTVKISKFERRIEEESTKFTGFITFIQNYLIFRQVCSV